MIIEAGGCEWKVHSTVMAPEGSQVGLSVIPFDIHIMRVEKEESDPGGEE
jgi:spermidine/putrescine transport system ATP-binding protein